MHYVYTGVDSPSVQNAEGSLVDKKMTKTDRLKAALDGTPRSPRTPAGMYPHTPLGICIDIFICLSVMNV